MRKHAVQQPTPRITSEHSRVPGILETAAERGLDEISIFFTHGMGPTDRCFGDEVATMINGLPREGNTCDQRTKVLQVCLGGSFTVRGEAEAESSFHIGRDCLPASGRAAASGQESTYSAFGKLRIERLSRIFRGRPIRIHLYSYWWDEDAWATEWSFVRKDLDPTGRTWGNNWVKENVINYGFSDAVLYTGTFGELMRQGMRSALCLMALESSLTTRSQAGTIQPSPCDSVARSSGSLDALSSTHLALLTQSLGSRILFDALDNADRGQPGKAGVDRMAELVRENSPIIYMAANQLPLLGLGQLDVSPVTPASGSDQREATVRQSFLASFLAGPRRRAGGMSNQIVAFYDPNDLLGYRAGGHLPPSLAKNIVEVTQYYATRWFIAANPKAAHAQSFSDPLAQRMILCGAEMVNGRLIVRKPC